MCLKTYNFGSATGFGITRTIILEYLYFYFVLIDGLNRGVQDTTSTAILVL